MPLSNKTTSSLAYSDKLFKLLYCDLEKHQFNYWIPHLKQTLQKVFNTRQHGLSEQWNTILTHLPSIHVTETLLNQDCVQINSSQIISPEQKKQLINALESFHPWRKGPYRLFDIHIDTEWRSDWKWKRIIPHISPLKDKVILDVGCGNGYHAWRMLGEQAKLVIGADPSQFFLQQFTLIKHYAGSHLPIHLLPIKSEEITHLGKRKFDMVFSMGVLYHRKSPIDHLQELNYCLRSGGELILETLIINQSGQHVLTPEKRYAKMRNVWFISSPDLICRWLDRVGFTNIKIVDITPTTTNEQRATPWMKFESLADFLNPHNPSLTIEGYPAPIRATFIATKK